MFGQLTSPPLKVYAAYQEVTNFKFVKIMCSKFEENVQITKNQLQKLTYKFWVIWIGGPINNFKQITDSLLEDKAVHALYLVPK